jgi:16S rRNA processing protein RimM
VTDIPDELVCIGVIARARGVTGELEVKPLGGTAERLETGSTVFLEKKEGDPPRPFRVTGVRKLNDRLGLTLDGVTTVEAARRLARESIMVDVAWLPDLPEGHYYHYQIVGLTVVDSDGETLGEIVEILSAGGNDVYVICKEENEILLPATDKVVVEIDLSAGRMTVNVPPGLIE